MLLISDLITRAYDNARDKGFHEHDVPRDRLTSHDLTTQTAVWFMNASSELSEAWEDVRARGVFSLDPTHEGAKPCGLPSELADLVIRLADTSGALGLDLTRALQTELAAIPPLDLTDPPLGMAVYHLTRLAHRRDREEGRCGALEPLSMVTHAVFLAHVGARLLKAQAHLSRAAEVARLEGGDALESGRLAAEVVRALCVVAGLCGALEIDLEAAILEKMAYNSTRPMRHGGKHA